ncbi:MATH domain-containing protein [Caerostris extrusa]|uniref:MATH domain-containing protein n=1 Tax=Caerostris extrusa TaxID=172846 RepID=A0AAV4SS09_CAEEX|nr:MATH domain-containing protein [Caerostris extrusa]
MEVKNNNKGKCFTFTWALENASYCFQKKGEEIKSPTFCIQWFNPTKWHLSLYPRGLEDGSYVQIFLCREKDDGTYTKVTDFEISLLAVDGKNLTFSKNEQKFNNETSIDYLILQKQNKYSSMKNQIFYPMTR